MGDGDDKVGGKGAGTLWAELEETKRQRILDDLARNFGDDEKRDEKIAAIEARVDKLEREEIRSKAASYAGWGGGGAGILVMLYEILQAMGAL